MKKENNALIYGVKVGDKYRYIGKTIKVNKQGEINASDCSRQYTSDDVGKVFRDNNVTIETIKIVPEDLWYDEKLHEVIKKHKDHNPLLNAQWMLEGKRGYWDGTNGYWYGKKRDNHTLTKLSESKFKKIIEYDIHGYKLKTWSSGKEIAIKILNDYKIVNGSAESKIYSIIDCKMIDNKLYHGSYWFKEKELIDEYGKIPDYLNISEIRNEQKQKRSETNRKVLSIRTMTSKYSVIQYNEQGEEIDRFLNADEAAYRLKTNYKNIRLLCRGKKPDCKYILRYGEKVYQPIESKYPGYKCVPLPMKPKVKKQDLKCEKRKPIIHYGPYGKTIETFPNVTVASENLGLTETEIRAICNGKVKTNIKLKYGKAERKYLKD